jgi:hypothetical protein
MTALDRYLRLEAVGVWRESPEAPPREVVVSFGKTTLLLSDLEERPLGHWALAGVREVGNDPDGAAVYAMSAGETLTIRDRDMVGAIAAVRRALPEPPRPKPRRPRRVGWILAGLTLVLAAVIGPPWLRRVTAELIPPEQATELGDRMLIAQIERSGPACDNPEGVRALAKLAAAAAAPSDAPRVRVIQLGETRAAALPGHLLLIDREVAATEPEGRITGWIRSATDDDPQIRYLVKDAGFLADLRYLLTGDFDDAALVRAAESASGRAPPTAPRGEDQMTESDWRALQAVCDPR